MKTWAVSFGEHERMELEQVIMDEDPDSALAFVKEVIYPKVKEIEKPGSCYQDPTKPVDELERSVDRHKKFGNFR